MRKGEIRIGQLLVTILLIMFVNGCGGLKQEASVVTQEAATSDISASDAATMGTDFNGNKTPAYAFFGDRTYEQRQFDASSLHDEYVKNTDAGSYTVMVYLDGSTNLEDPNYDYDGLTLGSATIDAILSSGVDPNKANIVIMTGGSDSWGHAGLEGNGNYILHVVKSDDGDGLSAKVDYHSEEPLSMGDPKTLQFLVNFAEKEYPADHYALMIWDHGNGPLYGCAVDENYNGDSLLLSEIAKALDATSFGESKKFDWIGFDCCLMSNLEVADTLSKYSYYMIASQELETGVSGNFDYGTAWVYSFLELLNSTSSPITISTGAIDQYADGKELVSSDSNTRTNYTMSLMDLSKVKLVENALDNLFYKMTESLEAGEYPALVKLREYTKEFNEGEGLDLVDLGYMTWTLEEMYPEESIKVKDAIESLVLYQRTNVLEASGVSLYYPYRNKELYDRYGGRDVYTELAVSDGYLSYLEKFTDILINGDEDADWEIDRPTADDGTSQSESLDEYTIHIPEEQQKGIARISYNVLQREVGNNESKDKEAYCLLLQDCQVAADENGNVHIPKSQKLLTLSGENGEQIVWPFKQVACGAQTAKYQSLATSVEGPFGAFAWTDSMPVTIVATETLGSGEPVISSICYRDEDDAIEGKSDVDISRYDYLAHLVLQFYAPSDSDSVPVWDWEQTGAISGRQIPIDSNIEIGSTMTSELEGEYVLQVVITDVHGNDYALELYELESMSAAEKNEVEIDGLNCTFSIYADHAVLEKVDGEAPEFTVPNEYEGRTITEIGSGAFSGTDIRSLVVTEGVVRVADSAFSGGQFERVSLPDGLESISPSAFAGCSELTDVNLPETLVRIGSSAFRGCKKLSVLEIPASITYIGDGAFEECSRLRHLTVAKGNKVFKAEENDDGNVLYTADGKELVACPSLFHSEYRIADGTERIRDRAFFGCYTEDFSGKADGSEGHNVVGYGLVRIEFPSTLKEIGDAAFFECNRLEQIDLPDGLEIIGIEAFGSTDYTGTMAMGTVKFEKDSLEKISIGKDVKWIGQAAFNSFTVDEFIVDERNQHYSSVDGRLMSKDENTVIDVYGE